MTKIATILTLTCASIEAFAAAQTLEVQTLSDERTVLLPRQMTLSNQQLNHTEIVFDSAAPQEIDYDSYISNGIIITPAIIENAGGIAMLKTLVNTHQKVYLTQSIDQQALLLSRAIMEYTEGGNASYLMQKILPSFWNAAHKISELGKYTLSITSPIITAASLLIKSLAEADADLSNSSPDDHSKLQRVLSGLNVASLVSFQLGKYVFNNMHDYSAQLKNYYLHATFEKEYLQSTFLYSLDQNRSYEKLPAKQKPYSKEDVVPKQYFEKLGPIATELARNIIADENAEQNSMLEFQKALEEEDCLKSFYRKSNFFSVMGGLFRIAAGACAVANTVISTTSLPMQDDMLSNIFGITQFCLTSFSLSLTELAKCFERKSGVMSKKFIIAPVLNPSLLETIRPPQRDDSTE